MRRFFFREYTMREQIEILRHKMEQKGIDCYIVTTTDAHNSEYVSEHDMVLEYMSGFSGSNGTLLVTKDEALLWTDGRYYIQCEKELEGSGIKMMRQGDDRDPSIEAYIASHIMPGQCIGFDGDKLTGYSVDRLLSKCRKINDDSCGRGACYGIKISYTDDLAGRIWNEDGSRPADNHGRIRTHDVKYAGKTVSEKLAMIHEKMKKLECTHFFISKLDDIMWLYNVRGEDVAYNPVAFSYAFITYISDEEKEAYFFADEECVSEETGKILTAEGVGIKAYGSVYDFLTGYEYRGNILADEREVSVKALDIMAGRLKDGPADIRSYHMVSRVNPTTELKSIKNDTEIKWMKEYFMRDSAAMTKYLREVKKIMGCADGDDFDEVKAAKLCDSIRLDTKDCFDLSFTTIAAYGANAAMMHYEATESSYSKCEKRGMLLTDCGGQYPGATTDVTRTIALGEVSDEEKRHFTLVLKGWLALMRATWIEGCTGRNLDILARQFLWNEGIDYKCGTGHGVGYCLNVHEGPQNIRWRYIEGSSEAVLHPGMIVTNEPGVYMEGRYGIRTENTMLVVKRFENDGDTYLGFENLTWVPIDEELIDYSLLDDKEKQWLKEYQNRSNEVFERAMTD